MSGRSFASLEEAEERARCADAEIEKLMALLGKSQAHAQSAENESANLKFKVSQLEARLREPKESPPWLADLAVALGQVAPDGTPLALNWTQAMAEVRKLRDRAELAKRCDELQARMSEMVEESRALKAENEALRQAFADAADSAAALSHSVSVHVVPDVRRADVIAFFRMAGQEVGSSPHIPSDKIVRLRMKLNAEEIFETLESCVHPSDCTAKDLLRKARTLVMMAIESARIGVNLPEAVDGVIDSIYVLIGMLVAMGVDDGPIWAEVHRANLTKQGGPKDANGKLLKNPDFVPPDVVGELRKQGWEA